MTRGIIAGLIVFGLFTAPVASADPEVLVEASGEMTLLGIMDSDEFWERLSIVTSFGPDGWVHSDGSWAADANAGCVWIGTTFHNRVTACAPFAPGEVTITVFPYASGAATLTIDIDRGDGTAYAVATMVESLPPSVSPLTPLFWTPSAGHNVSEQQVQAWTREHVADFLDAGTAYINVNGQEAILNDALGIVVHDARVVATARP